MSRAFVADVKQEMPGWVARMYASQIADGSGELYEKLVAEVLPRVEGAQSLLDVGCGPGHATELIARALPGARVEGIDLSDVLIRIARKKRKFLDNLNFETGNAVDLKFPDDMFDSAVSFMSIKAWPDRLKGVREMARVVRPNGGVGIFECDPDCSKQAAENFCSMWRWNLGMPGYVSARMGRAWYFRRFVARDGLRHEEIRSLIEEAGLLDLESFSFTDQPFAFAFGRVR